MDQAAWGAIGQYGFPIVLSMTLLYGLGRFGARLLQAFEENARAMTEVANMIGNITRATDRLTSVVERMDRRLMLLDGRREAVEVEERETR